MNGRIFIVAAEASGDALGADLIRALRARDATLDLRGVGLSRMAEEGVASLVDVSGLAVLGFVEGLMAYRRVKRAVADTVAAALAANPDVVVLIDSWGFSLRVAQAIRRTAPGTKLVKYIGPQVWATRPGRAATLAAAVDHLVCIHDFEPKFYAPYGLECTVCGHPALGRSRAGDGIGFRARHHIDEAAELLLVLPGSRQSEVRNLGPTFWRAALALRRERSELRLVTVAADAVHEAAVAQAPAGALVVGEQEKEDAFAAADVAFAASGTVTTEVALQATPVIVGYKLGWITWALARAFLFKARFASLMNVAANAEVAPEFLQTRFTSANLKAAALRLFEDEALRTAQVEAQNSALMKMGRGGAPAAEIAADAVLRVMAQARPRIGT